MAALVAHLNADPGRGVPLPVQASEHLDFITLHIEAEEIDASRFPRLVEQGGKSASRVRSQYMFP